MKLSLTMMIAMMMAMIMMVTRIDAKEDDGNGGIDGDDDAEYDDGGDDTDTDNATDDAIIIKVTQSLNNATNVSNINVTTPTGYNLIRDIRDAELRSWVFWKRSTGSETIPTVTLTLRQGGLAPRLL